MKTLNKLTTSFLSSILLLGLASCGSKTPILKDCAIKENVTFKSATILVSNEEFVSLGFSLGDSVNITFSNGFSLSDIPYYNGYYVKNGEPVLVSYPSDEYLTLTYNNIGIWDNASLSENYTVSISLNEKEKYLVTQNALGQSYSLDRSTYSSDEEFSNFRPLKGGSLKDNFLYRGASPVDNSRSRAKITDSLLEKNNIKCVIDLADSTETMNKYISQDDFASTYTKSLYDNDNMVLLSMGSGYSTTTYAEKLVTGLRYMLNHEGPYYIHCMEGKDRTGFVCFLIEALAGSTYEEMKIDYMTTYYNYYKFSLENDSSKYNAVVNLYFDSFVECLDSKTKKEDYPSINLVSSAKEYLKMGGMTDSEISSFITLISK